MHIYAFGSVCRGELDEGSDIDLLVCVDDKAQHIDNRNCSVYHYHRLRELWQAGNPFAWHLHLEARLVFSSNGTDFLKEMGAPQPYQAVESDCAKFQALFEQARDALAHGENSVTFHLSCMFLALRNFATCHTLALNRPVFSRCSPLMVQPALPMEREAFATLIRARLLSTRGYGRNLSAAEIACAIEAAVVVPQWMENLRSLHERIQQQN